LGTEEKAWAQDPERLLASLREHQALLLRLSELQRAIVERHEVQEVLQAVADGAAELLSTEVACLRLLDPDDPSWTNLTCAVGSSEAMVARGRHQPLDSGLFGRAVREGRLLVADSVTGRPAPEEGREFGAEGVAVAMVAPVYSGGQVAGSIGVASRDAGRAFPQRDRDVLLSLAEHASLALNHARAVEEAKHEALHDSLTTLPNRQLFYDRLDHALARAGRSGTPVGILFCDLDGFKTINDSLGHDEGDRLLVAVARRIAASLRPADTVARLGGDEFGVLLEELRQPGDAARAARRLLQTLESPFEVGGREVYLSASVGIAAGTGKPETLMRNADLAMYRAKSRGKGRYAAFEPGMHTAIVERLELEVDLKRAIEREELVLHYQPIARMATGEIAAMEALVRWRHPTRGLVRPGRFVPLAEESGQIQALGRWVLRTACHQAALWRAKYPAFREPGLQMGVNISGAQLREPRFADDVAEALLASQLEPSALTLEITESVLMEDSEVAVERLQELKELGVDLAIDDFGIGYSSLRYLRRFPLDNLKIEKSFVDGIGGPGEEPALLEAIVDLARIFGLMVVAEGIERPDQRDRLLALGCDFGQGHLFSEPVPAAETDGLLLSAGLLGDPADGAEVEEAPPSAEPPAGEPNVEDRGV
jgi:diguanylate cyclase (GGDEF)-like protein